MATVSIFGNHARVGSGSDYWGKMHDPFDPKFAESVRNSLRGVVRQVKGDPWCLGYFVDNELSWGGFGDEGGRYGLGLGALGLPAASSPAKRAILDQLKKKYGEISRLNAAWKTSLGDWQALEGSWKPAAGHSGWSTELKADLSGFVKELARTYFKTIRDQLKADDPDHLYLGCRFAWRTEEAVAASAEYLRRRQLQHLRSPGRSREVGFPDQPGPAGDHRRIPRRGPRPWDVPPRAGVGTRSAGTRGDLHRLCEAACWTTPRSWAVTGSSTSTSR